MKLNLTAGQKAVLLAHADLGKAMTDAALVPFAQHMSDVHQSSSSIRSRRQELVRKGLIVPRGKVKMPSGRKAQTYALSVLGKTAARQARREQAKASA